MPLTPRKCYATRRVGDRLLDPYFLSPSQIERNKGLLIPDISCVRIGWSTMKKRVLREEDAVQVGARELPIDKERKCGEMYRPRRS